MISSTRSDRAQAKFKLEAWQNARTKKARDGELDADRRRKESRAYFFEPSFPDETVKPMLWSSDPANGVSVVVRLSNLGVSFAPKLFRGKGGEER